MHREREEGGKKKGERNTLHCESWYYKKKQGVTARLIDSGLYFCAVSRASKLREHAGAAAAGSVERGIILYICVKINHDVKAGVFEI